MELSVSMDRIFFCLFFAGKMSTEFSVPSEQQQQQQQKIC